MALPKGGAAPNGEAVYEDGMIYKGVTQAGAANTTIIPASQYYKASRNIEEEYVYSASYVKFRELKFGYNIPRNWIKKIRTHRRHHQPRRSQPPGSFIRMCPISDPETAFTSGNAQGLEDLTLPTTRSYGFNINVKF